MCKFFGIVNDWFMQCSPSQISLTCCVFIEHKHDEYKLQEVVLAKRQALHVLACYKLQQGSLCTYLLALNRPHSYNHSRASCVQCLICNRHLKSSTCHTSHYSHEGTCILSNYSDLSHQVSWVVSQGINFGHIPLLLHGSMEHVIAGDLMLYIVMRL